MRAYLHSLSTSPLLFAHMNAVAGGKGTQNTLQKILGLYVTDFASKFNYRSGVVVRMCEEKENIIVGCETLVWLDCLFIQ